jgi:hypothetical protein
VSDALLGHNDELRGQQIFKGFRDMDPGEFMARCQKPGKLAKNDIGYEQRQSTP